MAYTQAFTPHSEQFGGTSPNTTTGFTTTGATFLTVAFTFRPNEGDTFSDSKGNTWTKKAEYTTSGTAPGVVIYICNNPTVGTGHTFTINAKFCDISIMGWTGNRNVTDPSDQVNGVNNAVSAGANQPGSITPTVDNCLVMTVVMDLGGTNPTTPSGYTLVSKGPTATAFAWGVAYQIQTTATATNPNWAGSVSGTYAANVISFLPPAVAPSNTGNFFMFY